jgi:hypothetical protein
MKVSPLPFAVWFPILDLAIWVSFFAMPAATTFLNLALASRGSGTVHIGNGSFSVDIPQRKFLSFALESASFRNSHIITTLNTPGLFGEALVSLPTTWPSSFRPTGMLLDEWRCLSLPFFCLPAWWLVGTGFDGWIEERRIHWSLALLGLILAILFIVLLIGLGVDAYENRMNTYDHDDVLWPLWGLGLWAVLFSGLPCAWWRQRRSRRIQPAQSPRAN